MKLEVLAPAKVNLGLEILGKRPDRYHEVNMIMQSVDLCDKIRIQITDTKELSISCSNNIDCQLEDNIVYKCAKLFFDFSRIANPGIDVYIEKNIPIGAGLAGGSADGAAVLIGLSQLFNLNLTLEQLMNLGAKIGADIPFCIAGGCVNATGIGTKLKYLNAFLNYYLILVKPQIFVSTKKAYEMCDNLATKDIKSFNKLITAIETRNLNLLSDNLFNRFEEVLNNSCVQSIKDKLVSNGALGAVMSGSGPTVLGIFDSIEKAEKCMNNMRMEYKQVFLCKPISSGAHIL